MQACQNTNRRALFSQLDKTLLIQNTNMFSNVDRNEYRKCARDKAENVKANHHYFPLPGFNCIIQRQQCWHITKAYFPREYYSRAPQIEISLNKQDICLHFQGCFLKKSVISVLLLFGTLCQLGKAIKCHMPSLVIRRYIKINKHMSILGRGKGGAE